MLGTLDLEQARFVALLANTARKQRDVLLGNVAEEDLDGPTPGRGEHNPTAALGVEPVPADISEPVATLREAVGSLSDAARGAVAKMVGIRVRRSPSP